MMISLLVTVFYISGIASAINATMTARTAQGAIAWSVALLSFPFVAVPAYWVFGRSKFEGFYEAYKENYSEINVLVKDIRQKMLGDQSGLDPNVSGFEAMEKLAGARYVGGNSVELLINGEETFDSIFEGIAAAQNYVLVQFYLFHDDGLGRRMQQALIERARAGVRVYVLYDEVGSAGIPESYFDELREADIEVSSFNTTQGIWNSLQINFRNHRKIVVVDGKSGWVGGHNVGDEYLGLDPDFKPFRDTHLRLDGPVVIQLQGVFTQDWYWATRQLPEFNWKPAAVPGNNVMALIISSAPTHQLETAGLMFVSTLNSAKHRVWISAPYFVPDEAITKALQLAALRGVDVRIIVPGKSDNWLVSLATYYHIRQLRGLGIQFYEYAPGFLHEKVGLVDDHTAWVSTANFDNRSFRLNFEVTALVDDVEFAAQMQTMLEADFAHARPVVPEELDQRSFLWRLSVSIARLASPVL